MPYHSNSKHTYTYVTSYTIHVHINSSKTPVPHICHCKLVMQVSPPSWQQLAHHEHVHAFFCISMRYVACQLTQAKQQPSLTALCVNALRMQCPKPTSCVWLLPVQQRRQLHAGQTVLKAPSCRAHKVCPHSHAAFKRPFLVGHPDSTIISAACAKVFGKTHSCSSASRQRYHGGVSSVRPTMCQSMLCMTRHVRA